jgi:hypothetical protein
MNKETAVSEEQNFYCEKLEMQKQRGQRDNLCKEQCDTCKNLHIAGRRQDREDAIDSIQSEELWKRMTDKQKADFIADYATGKSDSGQSESKDAPTEVPCSLLMADALKDRSQREHTAPAVQLSDKQLRKEAEAWYYENVGQFTWKETIIQAWVAARRYSGKDAGQQIDKT